MRTRRTPPPQFEDAEIVRRCLEGDTDAFGKLVDKYQAAVYATAYAYVHRRDLAEEVAQEAFVSAYTHLRELRNPGAFGPWLKEITCREAWRCSKEQGRHRNLPTPLPFRRVVPLEEVRDGKYSTDRDIQDVVYEAIESLPERYRLPVVLRYLQELTYNEIADFLGESQDEVRGLLYRASRLLREKLGGFRDNEERDSDWRPAHK